MREVTKIDIEIPKGDYLAIPITRKINGEAVPFGENDLLYFSVKKETSDEEYVIQKTLEDGITYDSTNKRYLIELNYNDTIELTMGENFYYDFTVYYEGTKPVQKIKGKLAIGDKLTLNEES